jgi:hypothetical protein
MVSLGQGNPGHRSGAYFFEDDSDEQSGSDGSPLVRRPPSQSVGTSPHSHIFTGYLSAMEALLLVLYTSALVGMSLYGLKNPEHLPPYRLVAYFAMIHVAVWAVVGVFDRIVQWRHQALRRKGYLKFYRNMRNVRRVPFIAVSIANSAVLLMVSLLYFYHVHEHTSFHGSFYPVYFLYIVVGLELLFVLPCLIYYIVRATMFNMARQPPDVISDTFTGSESPTSSVTAVGFRDGEDLDELLERQADMIRYLQQHNANLGRRILELQAGAME